MRSVAELVSCNSRVDTGWTSYRARDQGALTRSLVLAVTVAALAACGGATPEPTTKPPATPTETVLALFELARLDEPASERVDGLFGSMEDERVRAALLDAIEALRPADEVEIVDTYPMDDLIRMSFDLEGRLPGGGTASYSVQLDTSTEAGAIVWFSGPGVEWPDRKPLGPGLSTSAPPTPAAGG